MPSFGRYYDFDLALDAYVWACRRALVRQEQAILRDPSLDPAVHQRELERWRREIAQATSCLEAWRTATRRAEVRLARRWQRSPEVELQRFGRALMSGDYSILDF